MAISEVAMDVTLNVKSKSLRLDYRRGLFES